MTFTSILATVFEILMVTALFWCFLHEDRLIAFERKVFAAFRRRRLTVINPCPRKPDPAAAKR
ncbi:MAG: hypothetical protein ACOYJS_04070 [Acutalibacteraceae bacterium]|jgi:hypothetical protein